MADPRRRQRAHSGYSYGDLLRLPYTARLLGGTLLGRLPTGMGGLAITLYVRAHGGDYTLAGVLTAVYVLTLAAGQPLLGRAMDRFGQPRVLLAAALATGVGFAGLAAAGLDAFPLAVAAVVVAGFATPPLESGLRALWADLLRDPARLRTAYALDAASQETVFTTGPLLVVAAATVSTEAALLLTGLLGVVGTLVVTTSQPSKNWRGEPREADWAGALRSPGLRVLIGALACVGCSFGVLEVAVVSYGDARHAPVVSGILLAANSVGALCGGLVYGARVGVRLHWLVAGLAAGYVPLILAPPIPLMVVFAVLSGAFIAPVFACTFTLVDRLAPRGTVTEAFSWLVTAIGVGAAGGSVVAGLAGDLAGVHWALAGSAPSAGLALMIILMGRRTMYPAPSVEGNDLPSAPHDTR